MDNSDLEKLNRFRNEIIEVFSIMQVEILSITKTLKEVDPFELQRLTAKRSEVMETRASLVAHFEGMISPLE